MEEDLLFLEQCSNEQLKQLADIIVFDKDGKKRHTEDLSNTQVYVNNYPNNVKAFLPEIIKEYRRFGSNSLLALLGNIKTYKKILGDVCKRMKVPFRYEMPVQLVEQQLLQTLVFMSIKEMKDDDIELMLEKKVTKAELLKATDILAIGSPMFLRIVTIVVMQIAARFGLQGIGIYMAQFVASRYFAALAGPVGLALSSVVALYDLAGPAFRVTVPMTIYIAYYRLLSSKSEEDINTILS